MEKNNKDKFTEIDEHVDGIVSVLVNDNPNLFDYGFLIADKLNMQITEIIASAVHQCETEMDKKKKNVSNRPVVEYEMLERNGQMYYHNKHRNILYDRKSRYVGYINDDDTIFDIRYIPLYNIYYDCRDHNK